MGMSLIKDANDLLKEGKIDNIINCIQNAEKVRLSSVQYFGAYSREELRSHAEQTLVGIPTPFPLLNEMLNGGIKRSAVTLVTAATNAGKTTFVKQISFHLAVRGLKIGVVFLEESPKDTEMEYICMFHSIPFWKYLELSEEKEEEARKWFLEERKIVINHHDDCGQDQLNLLNKIMYMAKAEKCDFIIIDNLTTVVALQDSSKDGERKDIDRIMIKLHNLAVQCNIGIIPVIHVKRSTNLIKTGRGFEKRTAADGERISMQDLRGSGGLEMFADEIIALNGNQAKGARERLITVLKGRKGSKVGEADLIVFDERTGRLEVV
jgi:twinkle protein